MLRFWYICIKRYIFIYFKNITIVQWWDVKLSYYWCSIIISPIIISHCQDAFPILRTTHHKFLAPNDHTIFISTTKMKKKTKNALQKTMMLTINWRPSQMHIWICTFFNTHGDNIGVENGKSSDSISQVIQNT